MAQLIAKVVAAALGAAMMAGSAAASITIVDSPTAGVLTPGSIPGQADASAPNDNGPDGDNDFLRLYGAALGLGYLYDDPTVGANDFWALDGFFGGQLTGTATR
jgi:hypothetical protein